MIRWANRFEKQLPDAERGEVVPSFETKFFINVKEAQREANIVIRALKHFSAEGVEDAAAIIDRLEAAHAERAPHAVVIELLKENGDKTSDAQRVISFLRRVPTARIDNVDAIKIAICEEKTGFSLSHGDTFKSWAYKCVKNDILNRLRRRARVIESDAHDNGYLEMFAGEQELEAGLSSYEEVNQILSSAFSGDELIYKDLWFEKLKTIANYSPPAPTTDEVIDAVRDATGRQLWPSTVTRIKQRFLIGSHLALSEHCEGLRSLASLFQRLDEMEDKVKVELTFEVMMERIWDAFNTDLESVAVSKRISRGLWFKWGKLVQRNGVQKDILVEAYSHFKLVSPTRRFCARIEFYADHRFGRRVREIFITGEEG